MSTEEAEVMTDGEEEEEDDDDNEDGEKADLRGEEDEVGVEDEKEGRGLLMDRSTGSVCVWKCRS